MADVPQHLRDLVRRSEGTASVTALETEIRSQGAPVFKSEVSGSFATKIPIIAGWEWNYGVPGDAMGAFIRCLQEAEEAMVQRIFDILCKDKSNPCVPKIMYQGTSIFVTGERSWYQCRTVWAYRGEKPEAEWVLLLNDLQFKLMFKNIRTPFAKDPAATERLFSLLQLYTYPNDFGDDDDQGIATARQMLMQVTDDIRLGPE